MKIIFILLALVFVFNIVSAEIIWGGDSNVLFYIDSGGYICNNSAEESYWIYWEGSNQIRANSFSDCYKPEKSEETCCPYPPYTCDTDTSSEFFRTCVKNPVYLCGQYTNENSCNNANSNVGITTVEELVGISPFCNTQQDYNNSCVKFIGNCRCEWKNGQCDSLYDSDIMCPSSSGGRISLGKCDFSFSEIRDECEESGFLYYITRALWTGDVGSNVFGYDECKDKESRVDCGKPLLKLPGFSFFALILSVFLIFFIYYLTKMSKHVK
jgi:hypothetical protein